MRYLLSSILLLGSVFTALAQQPGITRSVRGTILDTDNRQPVPGAVVVVVGSDPLLSGASDMDGRFLIHGVRTGRIDLRVRSMGYQEVLLPNVLVDAGKETVLTVLMESSAATMEEVAVTADRPREQVRNDMAELSVRKISVEETSRIAGGINDPARTVTVFPGVAGDATGDNSIVVRGNSPKGVLWRLEGMEIPNPNHFSDEGTTGGPINVLNSDVLDDSEFYTGAYPAEFGNAMSAVYDMRLRNGNDRKREYTLKVGVLGTDLTAEGPLPGVEGGSYLANYRYSTLALLDGAGIVDYGGVPKYTDAAFKLRLPAGKAGAFSLFGLGGRSNIQQNDKGTTGDTLFARSNMKSRMGVMGLSHTRTLGSDSYVHSTVAVTGNGSGTSYHEVLAPGEGGLELRHRDDVARWSLRVASTLNNRINADHKLRSGVILTFDRYKMFADTWGHGNARMERQLDASGSATTVQAFTSWKWRWNTRWSMVSGVHLLHFAYNSNTSVEPRMALRYQQKPTRAFTFGGGLHSRMEPLLTYEARQTQANGSILQPNRALGLARAAHVVFGYEQRLSEDVRFKVEAYYQHHFNLPVENDPTSAYALLNNSAWFTTRSLVNRGVGRNFGVEASVEKYFTKGYHYMVSVSLSDARYKALDGVWRHGRFDLGTVANALVGKEWRVGPSDKDRTLSVGGRYTLLGGQYATPIDLQASIAMGEQQETGEPWSVKGTPIQKLDVVVSYRIGRPKVSHEFKLDIQNVLNADTPVYHYYDRMKQAINAVPQLAMLPVLQYTLRF